MRVAMNCLNGVFVLKPNKNIELALMRGLVMKKSRGERIRTSGLYVPNETAQRGGCCKSLGKPNGCRALAPMLAPDRRNDRKLRL